MLTRRLDVRLTLATLAALLLLVRPVQVQEPWVPPIGIPAPSFGIDEQAPDPPDPWRAAVPGFYYVDASDRQATDAGNPYGYPGSPRATIPTRLPAGAVVELNGIYDHEHSSPHGIVAEGTRERPVFIRAADPARPPAIVRFWEVGGSYVILDHLKFRDRDGVTTGSLVFQAPAAYAALRHSEVSGNLASGGLGIESWDGRSVSHDVVIYHNRIHDNGDVHANFDQDRHGIHVGARANHVWVVDNEMWRNSGDGIQINAGSRALEATTHHIYVGRNVSHHNKQNGFWTKQAVDVIFSQNVAYSHRPGNSSMGVGLGFQYAPSFVWFLFNRVYDSDYGIQAASDSDLGTGTDSFYIGNVIFDIHDSDGDFNPGTSWHNCAISLAGGVNRYVVNNTIYDVDSGICSAGASGQVGIYDNLVFKVRPDGQHVFLELAALASASRGAGNVFGPNYRAMTGGVQRDVEQPVHGPRGSNVVVRDPGMILDAAHLFDLTASSPAVDAGIDDPAGVYATYLKRYGLDIRRDVHGRRRPLCAGYDAGASEWDPGAMARAR
jgi:Right handed beta helix region